MAKANDKSEFCPVKVFSAINVGNLLYLRQFTAYNRCCDLEQQRADSRHHDFQRRKVQACQPLAALRLAPKGNLFAIAAGGWCHV